MEEILSDDLRKRTRKRRRRGYNDPYAEGVRCLPCNRNIKFEELGKYTYRGKSGNLRCSECGTMVRRRSRVSGSGVRATPKQREYQARLKRY